MNRKKCTFSPKKCTNKIVSFPTKKKTPNKFQIHCVKNDVFIFYEK